jgi:hypothetical protein
MVMMTQLGVGVDGDDAMFGMYLLTMMMMMMDKDKLKLIDFV